MFICKPWGGRCCGWTCLLCCPTDTERLPETEGPRVYGNTGTDTGNGNGTGTGTGICIGIGININIGIGIGIGTGIRIGIGIRDCWTRRD